MTIMRYEEILRMLEKGFSNKTIARALKCSRNTVSDIRAKQDQGIIFEKKESSFYVLPNLDWESVRLEVSKGYELVYIWEDRAKDLISYSGFWKQFYKIYPEYKTKFVTHRYFKPGEYCEVDYAGFKVEYVIPKTGELKKAPIFIGVLCHSQLIFAHAKVNMKSEYFLDCHRLMYEFFKGTPRVTVPDCLKQGVSRTHLYDPDINESYSDLAKHYNTSIVAARPGKPKDKAIVEGAVRLVTRYFRYKYRNHTFTSIKEINECLATVLEKINNKVHTRFKISRYKMWEENEKEMLNKLPEEAFSFIEYKEATVYPDSHVSVHSNNYSVPYIYRGKKVKVRISEKQVAIYYDQERIALHARSRNISKYITEYNHLPENAKAYYDATPQSLLSRSKFISNELYDVIDELFKTNALGNIRRVQGLIRASKKEVSDLGIELSKKNIAKACKDMNDFNQIRVSYFKSRLQYYRKLKVELIESVIKRNKDNPMLRYDSETSINIININNKLGGI